MTTASPAIALPTLDAPSAVRTHCPYCAFQCGMLVTPDPGERPTVTADPDFPVNRGQMCVKGFNSGHLLEHPDRVLQPLRRNAAGALQEVTWDEALGEIAGRIAASQQQHGRDSIGVFGSGALTNEKAYWLGKFARVALKTANIDYNGRYCMASAAVGANRSFGIDRGLPFPVEDIAGTGCAMLWGSNLVDTLPPIVQYFTRLKANGGKVVVVDPRKTETARLADLHLQPVPGTDLMLANGLLHIAIDEEWIDRDYIARRTSGFDAVLAASGQYWPAHVERVTGVGVEAMRQAVRWLAESPSMILSGRGPEQQSKGSDTVTALINLMLALGKPGRPCSGYGTLTGQGNGQGGREHGQKADQLPGYRLIENTADRRAMAAFWGVDENDLPRKGKSAVELLDSCGGDVKALLVVGSNLAVGSPNADRVIDRLRSLDLLVVVDAYLSETAELADFVLPTLQFAEEDGTMTNLEGRVIRRRKLQAAPPGPRDDLEILSDLATRLGEGPRFAKASAAAVFDELARATAGGRADYSGISYARLDLEDGVFWPCPSSDHPGTPRLFADRFATPDGRAKFVAVDHRDTGEPPDEDYPIYFITGRYKEHYNSGAQTRRVAPLAALKPKPRAQIHPHLAAALGVLDGGPLRVESRRGVVVLEAHVTADIRPDCVFAPFHWGGRDAANVLTNPALDPLSKMPEFKLCAVRVVGATPASPEV